MFSPSITEILESVEEVLRAQAKSLQGSAGYELLVSRHLLQVVRRELAAGGVAADHRARLAGLGVASDAELAASIRAGRFEGRYEEVADVVRAAAVDALRIDNPGHLPIDGS